MTKQHKIYTHKNANVEWSVSKPNYVTKSDNLNIQEDTILYVSLDEEIRENTLTVVPTPNNANVTFYTNGIVNGNSITVKQFTNIKYTVSLDGYYSKSGEIIIEDVDKTIYVSLESEEQFKYVIKGNSSGQEFTYTIGFRFGIYNVFGNETLFIDWGDGSDKTIITDGDINSNICSHKYSDSSKEYIISISSSNNVMPYINMNNQSANTIKVLTPFLKMVDSYGNPITKCFSFSHCSSLTSIPPKLFVNNPQITMFRDNGRTNSLPPSNYSAEAPYDFINKFHGLKVIYAHGYSGTRQIHNMSLYIPIHTCFGYCSSLKTLPEDLFDYTPNITDLDGCFQSCGLTDIPENLFNNVQKVTSFTGTFSHCKDLIKIPQKLFYNNKNATHYNGTFAYCTSLIRLPEGLFRSNLKIPGIPNFTFENYGYGKHFNLTFKGCTNLKYGIDGGSIKDSITEITLTNYKGDEDDVFVPSEVDSPNINVNDYDYTLDVSSNKFKPEYYINGDGIFPNTAETFNETFMNCENLIYVPTNTFRLCSNTATEFMATFLGCKKLEYVGDDLFENMQKAYLFGNIYIEGLNPLTGSDGGDEYNNPRGTFSFCNMLKINQNMFGDLNNFFTYNISDKIQFGAMFFRNEFTGTNCGIAPKLWEYNIDKVSGEHCFGGNGNKYLTNYNEIPELWKLGWHS